MNQEFYDELSRLYAIGEKARAFANVAAEKDDATLCYANKMVALACYGIPVMAASGFEFEHVADAIYVVKVYSENVFALSKEKLGGSNWSTN